MCFIQLQNFVFSTFYKHIGIQMKTWPMSQNMTFRGSKNIKEKKNYCVFKTTMQCQNYHNMTTFYLLIDNQWSLHVNILFHKFLQKAKLLTPQLFELTGTKKYK